MSVQIKIPRHLFTVFVDRGNGQLVGNRPQASLTGTAPTPAGSLTGGRAAAHIVAPALNPSRIGG